MCFHFGTTKEMSVTANPRRALAAVGRLKLGQILAAFTCLYAEAAVVTAA